MTTVTTLAAIISLILALAGAGEIELAKKKKQQSGVTQQQFDQYVKDNGLTDGEYWILHEMK